MHTSTDSIFLGETLKHVEDWYFITQILGLKQSSQTAFQIEKEERLELEAALSAGTDKEILDGYLDCLWTSANLVRQGLRTFADFEYTADILRQRVEQACDLTQLELLPETIYLNWKILVRNNASKILRNSRYTKAQLKSLKNRTLKKYKDLGISAEILNNLFYSCFVVAKDCHDTKGKFHPAGKILKPINWREPQWLIPKKLFIRN